MFFIFSTLPTPSMLFCNNRNSKYFISSLPRLKIKMLVFSLRKQSKSKHHVSLAFLRFNLVNKLSNFPRQLKVTSANCS